MSFTTERARFALVTLSYMALEYYCRTPGPGLRFGFAGVCIYEELGYRTTKLQSSAQRYLVYLSYAGDHAGTLIKKCLAIRRKLEYQEGGAAADEHIGFIYKNLKQYDSAMTYFELSAYR